MSDAGFDADVLDAPVGGLVEDVGFAVVLDELGFVAVGLVVDEAFGGVGLVDEEVEVDFLAELVAVLVFLAVDVVDVFAVVVGFVAVGFVAVGFVAVGFVAAAVSRRTADCPADCPADCAGLRTCERTVSLLVEAPVFGATAGASGSFQSLIPAMESCIAEASGERG